MEFSKLEDLNKLFIKFKLPKLPDGVKWFKFVYFALCDVTFNVVINGIRFDHFTIFGSDRWLELEIHSNPIRQSWESYGRSKDVKFPVKASIEYINEQYYMLDTVKLLTGRSYSYLSCLDRGNYQYKITVDIKIKKVEDLVIIPLECNVDMKDLKITYELIE